jgi:hypothetical protein
VDDHFRGKPAWMREAFDKLLARVGEFGPVRVDAVKSGINLGGRAHFAMVFPRKSFMDMELILPRPVSDSRIQRDQKAGESMYIYTLRLTSQADVDPQLLSWLREAYTLRGTDLPPNNQSSLMLGWKTRRGATDGQKVLHTGADYQQAA